MWPPLARGGDRRVGRTRLLVGISAVAVCVAGVTLVLGHVFAGWLSGSERTQPVAGSRPAFVRYVDPQGRFAVSYPKSWRRVPSSDPQVALLVRRGPASRDSMQIRVVPLPQAIDSAHLADAKKITDAVVKTGDVRVLAERRITLNGLSGFYYLYTFGKPGSGRFGVHAHYFLFARSTMYALVFQALPDTHFVKLAPTFDRIARSFRAYPTASPSAPAFRGHASPPANRSPVG